MTEPSPRQEPDLVIAELDNLLESDELGTISTRPIAALRGLRDRLAEIETGLSFGRRMAQGRLDIVMAELEARAGGSPSSDVSELLGRLPEVLARHTRGGGTPRPIRDIELPAFADTILDDLDRILGIPDLAAIGEVDVLRLSEAAESLATFERAISARRHEVHRLVDDVQEEIIGRYRSGAASVDDLLK